MKRCIKNQINLKMARKNEYIQEVDQFVGSKIYSLRLAKGLSRQQLAEVIEVTHQQLQKYEKGINRISIGRILLNSQSSWKGCRLFF